MGSGGCRFGAVTFLLFVLLGFVVRVPAADVVPDATAEPATADVTAAEATPEKSFSAIRARIAAALTGDAWLKKEWRADELQADVDRLVEEVRAASGKKQLKVPVRFADIVPAPIQPGGPPTLKDGLLIAGDAEFSFADKSIVLATGSVRISHVTDCVIIAGGAVDVSHCRNSVVVAGSWVQMSFDGDPRAMMAARGAGPAVAPNASILLAGGVINVSHLMGSVCAARTMHVSNTSGATFLGVKESDPNTQQVKEVKDAKLPSAPRSQPNPLLGKLGIVQVVEPQGERKPAMVVARIRGGPEVVIRPGQPVRDGNGEPVEELKGWTLSFVGDGLALFTKGHAEDSAMFDLKAASAPGGPAASAR